MCYGETEPKSEVRTPMLYDRGDLFRYEDRGNFIKELSALYNKYNIDAKLNMFDYLLAEMTLNLLVAANNTMQSNLELKK